MRAGTQVAQQLTVPAAKISQPRVGVPLLRRPRLFPAIHQALHKKLLVLSAEAGYGKTSLLLSALSEIALPAAWLTLDDTDTDLHLFAAGLVAALRAVSEDFGAEVLDILTTGPSDAAVRSGLLRELERLPETLIVLDDLHAVDNSPAIQELIDHLLAAWPPSAHLIVASRTWPRLRLLPRLLVAGEATVLDKNSLGFNDEETAAFFLNSHGLHVDEQEVRRLTQRTEGWPAALQLFALASLDRGALVLEGTPREIFDYLASAVLEGLHEAMQEFLLRTSILAELSPALCGAVVDHGDPATLLEALDRANLFIYRLDASGTRYRYHQLFAEFLQQRLARRGEGAVAALHRRAAQHLEVHGVADQAVRHYLAAGAYEDAERVMKPYHGDRLTARLAYVFRELVARLPEDIQIRYPWMLRTGASSARFVGDYHGALGFAKRAMEAAEGTDPNLWAFSVHGVGVMYSYLDRYEDAVALCRAALPRLDDRVDARFTSGVLAVLADCALQLGDLEEAGRATEARRVIAMRGTEPGKGLGTAFVSGLLAMVRLEYTAARDHLHKALEQAEERGSLSYKTSVLIELARAELAAGNTRDAISTLERAQVLHGETGERASNLTLTHLTGDAHLLRGDLDGAEHWYQQTLAKCQPGESEEPRAWAYLGLARVAQARGTAAEAESLLSAALQICERVKLGKILPQLWLEQVRLWRMTGRSEAALTPLSRAKEIFARWRSPQGLARCGFFEARLRRDLARGVALPVEPAEGLTQTLEDSARAPGDMVSFLRREPWTVDLLVEALEAKSHRAAAEALLVQLGPMAVPPLIDALKKRAIRIPAIRLLGRLGDPRARRPLTRLITGAEGETRQAASDALALLREPEPIGLRIFLFGRFEVFRGEERIEEAEWKTQKVKGVLKYLLLHRGQTVHQDQLIDLFWPESGPVGGAMNLKAAVKNLRLALEPLLEGTRSHFVLREGQTLRFQSGGPCWVDLDDYRAVLEAARDHDRSGRSDQAIAAYEQVAGLHRGDLLSEDIYEDWMAAERERWREAQIDALASLARLYAEKGDVRRAAEFTRRVLELDRLREVAYRDLMEYLLRTGDRSGALRAYRTCEQLLREELGVAPAPETTALFERARGAAS